MSLRVMTPNYFGYHCKTGIVHLTITVYKVSIFRLEELGWVLQHWVRTEKTYLSPSRTNRVSTTVFSVPVKMLLWRGRDLESSRTGTPRNHAPCGHVFEKSSTLGRDPEDSKRRRGKNFTWNSCLCFREGPHFSHCTSLWVSALQCAPERLGLAHRDRRGMRLFERCLHF